LTKTAVKIPRGTCRLFGTIKAISNIKNSAIVVHGPKGCVYHINYIMGMRGDKPSNVYSTCMDENDVIFGAEEKLKDAIEELDAELNPELLAVLSCCASSIIGEDVERAVQDVATHATVIGIESGGFEGDYRTGYSETLKRLVDVLVQVPDDIDRAAVNLVGMLRGGPDLKELKKVLALAGLRVNAVLTADATLQQIRDLGSAALNIVVCEATGREAAELLEQKFGMSYIIEEIPIGYEATKRFLARVGDALGIRVTLDHLVPKRYEELPLTDRRVAVIGGPTRAVSMTRFLGEIGIAPKLVVVDFDSDTKEKLDGLLGEGCEVLIEPEQEKILEKLDEMRIDLIIGGMLEKPMALSLGLDHIDMMHGSQKTLGFEGADNLITMLRQKGTYDHRGLPRKE
jgi:light-independent protochlorophyllide reductase B subunit